jgi:hypothetical protein
MTRARGVSFAMFTAAFFVACNGILGIDVPDLRAIGAPEEAADGSREEGGVGPEQDATVDTSAPDASVTTDGADAQGATDAPVADTGSDALADAHDAGSNAHDAACGDGDFASDPSNCGACGHSCLGGACVDGGCMPVVMAYGGGWAQVVDSTAVYWYLTSAQIVRLPLDATYVDGGDAGMTGLWSGGAFKLTQDSTQLYWTTGGAPDTIASVGKDGSNPHTVTTVGATIYNIAIQGDRLYFTTYNTPDAGQATSVLVDGSAPFEFADGDTPIGLAVDDASIYWSPYLPSTAPEIVQSALDGTSPHVITSGYPAVDAPRVITTDESFIYWAGDISGYKQIWRIARGGTLQEKFYEDPSHGPMLRVGIDAQNVYWMTFDDFVTGVGYFVSVFRCAKSAPCVSATVLAEHLPIGGLSADLAVGADAVYWTYSGGNTDADGGTAPGALVRVAK